MFSFSPRPPYWYRVIRRLITAILEIIDGVTALIMAIFDKNGTYFTMDWICFITPWEIKQVKKERGESK